MGYEIIMLVTVRSGLRHDTAQVGNRIVNVYDNDAGDGKEYFTDPDTRAALPDGALVKNGSWFQLIATVDLCKVALPSKWICKFEDSDGEHLYPPFEGNELLGLDKYGMYRRAVPVAEVIEELTRSIAGQKEPYRRYVAALALLASMKDKFTELYCFFYGH